LMCLCTGLYAQSVPVTFHFKPPSNVTFTKLRLVGSFNGWNNADDALLMTGPDPNTGEYSVTTSLAVNTDYGYKFCMDANWSFAYGDPDNPRINTSDNDNSMISAKNPMITYLLPRDITTKGDTYIDNTTDGAPIRAIFAFSADKVIDTSKITLSIDGVAIPWPARYYNSATKELIYTPKPVLAQGNHTIAVSITSAAGTDQRTSTFKRDLNYVNYKIPVDFYYDQNNKVASFQQTLSTVSAVGTFNNWNDALNPLSYNSEDGLWETTAYVDPGSHSYKFKLNGISWVNDPDWPLYGASADGNNAFIATADSFTTMKLLQPGDNKTFRNDTTVAFKVLLRPGVKSKGIDNTSIKILLDNVSVTPSYDITSSVASANLQLKGDGRHIVTISFKNKEGVPDTAFYTYGIYNHVKGVYCVDGAKDEKYKYPSGVADGSGDILSVNITETTKHDSLKFSIQMRKIDARTRLGLLITNPVNTFVDDPRKLNIKLPDWTGQGVFASIGWPGNQYENTAVENRFLVSRNPDVYEKNKIIVTSDAATMNKGIFEFTISLQYLDSLMGNWKQARQFGIFSFIAATDKSGNAYIVTAAEGGTGIAEEPEIYDAAFMRSAFWQKRMLSAFIPAGQQGGPHSIMLDGSGRGFQLVNGTDISDSLAHFGTDITFLTPGGNYWYKDIVVHGALSDTTITKISFTFNNATTDKTISGGKFDVPVVLVEGKNVISITAVDSKGFKSTSKDLVLTYTPDKNPTMSLTGTVNKREVTLVVAATSPIGAGLSYFWTPDNNNPAAITINSISSSATFTVPSVDGEYTVAATVMDDPGNFAFAKIIIVSAGDSLYIPDNNYHAKWIDDAVFYEIYPRSFSQQGGFQGITDKIPQIKDLGVNAVWLMPVFEGPTVHGYEITDYYSLEKDYGTEADFKTMLNTFKQYGIKVILDYVVNHTAVSHPFMQSVLQYKEYSPYANFYIWSGEPGNSAYAYYYDWTSLPNLNHNNPDVRKYFINVAKYWMQNYEIAGYRCDVAWGVQERNTQFWLDWRKAVKAANPSSFLEAEASSSDSTFYQNRFDSANDWDLRTDLLNMLNGSGSLAAVHSEATRKYSTYARPFRFIENHDETRATAMFDSQRSLLLHTIIFTLNGVPLIYSGGEVGELTNRDMIKWDDPHNMKPYFKRLIEIRKTYVHNPAITIIPNTKPSTVYSYSSVSGNNALVTVANFKDKPDTTTINLSALYPTSSKTFFLTDLFSGKVYTINERNASIILSGYQARVFYYGPDSVHVITAVAPDKDKSVIPTETKLFQNYPNPFNPTSVIRYQTAKAGLVSLKVYDILGREVATLVNEVKNPGTYECTFNGAKLSSGVYFYQLKAGNYTASRKFIILK